MWNLPEIPYPTFNACHQTEQGKTYSAPFFIEKQRTLPKSMWAFFKYITICLHHCSKTNPWKTVTMLSWCLQRTVLSSLVTIWIQHSQIQKQQTILCDNGESKRINKFLGFQKETNSGLLGTENLQDITSPIPQKSHIYWICSFSSDFTSGSSNFGKTDCGLQPQLETQVLVFWIVITQTSPLHRVMLKISCNNH